MSALRLEIVPSRLWLGWVGLSAAVLCVLLPWLLSPLALLPLPWLLWRALRADGWFAAGLPLAFVFDPAGRTCLYRGAQEVPLHLLDDCVAWPWLIVLRYEAEGRHVSRLLLPDSAPAEMRRRLRVLLRWAPFHPPLIPRNP